MAGLIKDPIEAITGIASQGLGIIDQLVEDKDKRAEYGFELAKLTMTQTHELLMRPATSRVDGLVKFMIAWRDVILPTLRPLGSALLTAGAWYLEYKGTQAPEWVLGLITASFPTWMVSRHIDKLAEKKEETKRLAIKTQQEAAQSGNPFFVQYD